MWKWSGSSLSALGLACTLGVAPFAPTLLHAQDSVAADRERQIAEKFLQVLLRRPSPGTALDRVYGYHIQAGTLDQLMSDLKTEADQDGEDAGARYMLLGLLQSHRGNDAESAASFAKAEERRSEDAMASYYHGRALLMVGRTDAAAEAFERAIDRKPARTQALPVFTELGRLYQRSQQNEKALSVWNRLEESFPGDARVGEQIAQTLADEGQDEAALQRYEKLAQKSGQAEDYRSIGYRIAAAELKRRMGRADQSLADFEAILQRLRPSSWLYADVRRRIEAGFLRSGDYAALADYYLKQVEKTPDEIELRMRLGQTLAKAGRLNEAESALLDSIRLAPENADARLALVEVLKSAGKAEAAAEQLEALVQQDPENPDYLVRLGNTWLDARSTSKTKRRQAAADAWQRLADARKDDAVVTAQVGDLMRRIERTDDALELYRRAIELAPEQPQYREYLGEFLHKLDREDEALEAWVSIAEGPRENRDNLIRLAEVLSTFERSDESLQAFAKAAELDLTFSHRLRYSELLSRASRYEDSLAQLDLAQTLAENPEEREQLLQARIQVYGRSGTLDEQIESASRAAESEPTVENYRRLALMFDAATRIPEATEAIESAMKADPTDIGAMEVAAELYRKASRSADAVEVYRSLAKNDPRFLPNYLKRIASLQMTLGQIDQAMETAEELIAAQPGNPESYRFYAEQCFRVGRDDEGIERLRRALRAAPRDRDARVALAKALSDRFRTDEAIELYWQLLTDSDDLSEQSSYVGSLARLYERKGDFDRLLTRIELRGRESSDMRSAILLAAEAHRATNDLGSARSTLQPLLVENPRDAELLQQMVSLSEAADDPEFALGYQRQLVELADTAENRSKLLTLMVDSGRIDTAEASLQRLRALEDPVTIVKMIDRTIRRKENEGAIRFCRAALERRSDLWEIRARLSALLLAQGRTDEALQEADAVDAMDLADTVPSETAKAAKLRAKKTVTRVSPFTLNGVLSHVQIASRLASFFRVGRYASGYYTTSMRTDVLDVKEYGQAKVMTTAVRLAAAAKDGKLKQAAESMADLEALKTSEDLAEIQHGYVVASLSQSFGTSAYRSSANPETQKGLDELTWRLVELDAKSRPYLVYRLLSTRARQRRPNATLAATKIPPLSEKQLEVARLAFEESLKSSDASSGPTLANYLASFLHDEFDSGGNDDLAKQVRDEFPTQVDNPADAARSLRFYAATRRPEDVGQLIDTIREHYPQWVATRPTTELAELSSGVMSVMALPDVDVETKLVAVDLAIASQAVASAKKRPVRRGSSSTGMLNTYLQIDGRYQSKQIAVPFSQRLLPTSMAQQLFMSGQFTKDNPVGEKLIAHLEDDKGILQDDPALGRMEESYRRVLAAFAHWWLEDVQAAFDGIVVASNASPDDNDLWIERARLAAELERPQASLDALDAIHPVDQATLRVRELAAMNLAARLGQLDRAKTAARRLFGMRLDSATEMALADQLTRMGMQEMATAILQRTQRRGGQSARDLLELANRYLTTGENEAAAEVAFSALRKLSQGRELNESTYRRRAVDVLQKAGRLDPLLKQAEQRVASAPKSLSLKNELAELYSAAGRKKDADKIFEGIAAQQPNDPRLLWSTAERLYRARKYDEAVDLYLTAIEKQPEMLRREYYKFERAVSSSKNYDKAYKGLMKLDLKRLDSSSLGRMMGLYRRSSREMPKSAEAFLEKVLSEAPVQGLGEVLRNVASDQNALKSKPVGDAVERVFSSDSTYEPTAAFWMANSYSSGGNLNGPLKPCIEALEHSPELGEKIRQILVDRCAEKDADEIAQILLMVVEARNRTSEQVDEIAVKLLEGDHADALYRLWWQVAQVFEKIKGLENTAVTILEGVRDSPQAGQIGMEFEYSLDAKLMDAYVLAGQKTKARRELMHAYLQMDNSSQNQYNPGYGDYKDLRMSQSIGEKLQKVGANLQAIRVYSDMLSKPKVFQSAKRWDSNGNYQASFEKALKSAVDSLSEQEFSQFLELSSLDSGQDPEQKENQAESRTTELKRRDSGFDLVALSAKPGMTPEQSSIAAMVAHGLASSEEGRARLREFDEQAKTHLQEWPNDLSTIAMRAMVATHLDRDDAAERFAELTQLIPAEETPQADDAKASRGESKPTSITTLLSLYSSALVGLDSQQPAVVEAASGLADRLIKVAVDAEKTSVVMTLATANLGKSEAANDPDQIGVIMQRMLDSVTPGIEPSDSPKVATMVIAEQCVEIAEQAAEQGAWGVALEALRRGFAGGPPLRNIAATSSSGSAFVVPARQLFSSTTEPAVNLDQVTHRVIAIVEPLLGEAEPNEAEHGAKGQPGDEDDRASIVYQTLRDIVMPVSRGEEMFPYAPSLVQQDTNASGKPDLNPASLARSLARAAVASKKVDPLRDLLTKRCAASKNPIAVDLVRVHLAIAGDDEERLRESLDAISESAGITIPSVAENPESGSSRPVRKPKVDIESMNLLLHAILPTHEKTGLSPQLAKIESHLLEQASRVQALANPSNLWSWLTRELINDEHTDQQQAKEAADRFLASVVTRYANYSGDYGERRADTYAGELVRPAILSKRWALAGELLRRSASDGSNFSSSAITTPAIALDLLASDAEAQYGVLSRMVFGDADLGDDETLVRSATLCLYVEPPPAFRSVTPYLDRVSQVSIGNADFPITSLALMLADVAAKIDKTDELVERLRPHSKKPGDEVEAMIGQALLAAGQNEQAEEILQRVEKELIASKPNKSVRTEMPMESALFTARAMEVDSLNPLAKSTWSHLRWHGNRRSIGLAMSFFDRVAITQDMTHSAGAEEGSPDPNWLSLQQPYYGSPVSALTVARFVERDGTLHCGAGADSNVFMLKYPLAGDFSFSHKNVYHGWGGSHNVFGGTSYVSRFTEKDLTARAMTSRNSVNVPNKELRSRADNHYQLAVEGDKVRVLVNEKELMVDERTETAPFVGVFFYRNVIPEVADIQINGQPTIPREVKLLAPQLRGWSCPIITGRLIGAHLPITAEMDAEMIRKQREQESELAEKASTWFVRDGELNSGEREASVAAGQRHLQYIRPLLSGESFSYEFFYQPGVHEVHPSIGRIVVLLRPGGAKLRWLSQVRSLESFQMEALHEVEPDELLGTGIPDLREGEWNRVELIGEKDHVTVKVNGTDVCRFKTSLDQRFGWLSEKQRSVRVRDATLTGPWPKTLEEALGQ